MPDLRPVNAVLGELKPEVAAELGLLPGTRVVMGSGDSHAATVGAGCVRDYDGYFSIGTTAWLSCHVPWKKTDVAHSIATMPAALPGRYIVSAEQGTAGRCLEFLKNNILFPVNGQTPASSDLYGILNAEAGQVAAGSDGLIFTPWINGVLAPREDHYTRSAFFNQTARTTRAHYVRAVMEGVAFNLRWLKGHVEKFIGRPFAQLNFIGGGAVLPGLVPDPGGHPGLPGAAHRQRTQRQCGGRGAGGFQRAGRNRCGGDRANRAGGRDVPAGGKAPPRVR